MKNENPSNEPPFTGQRLKEVLKNPYRLIIANEARRRGIGVELVDAEDGCFALDFGGRRIICCGSLTELTTAIAVRRCYDKALTRRLLHRAGLQVPDQCRFKTLEQAEAFLSKHHRIVVKPARGEEGAGISVDVRKPEELAPTIEFARRVCETVLLEEFCVGEDLRIVVIDFKVIAAAVRHPARIIGTGRDSIAELIRAQSRRRRAATGGESSIPLDEETERCVRMGGYAMDDVLAEGEVLVVRKTANVHTGGTIHDVTPELHPVLAEVACTAARVIDIPVIGLDLLVPGAAGSDYVIIEANEQPGLANHEPQPTAERFVDLLFPQTADPAALHWKP